jgi:tetratricopeptide (TPR) repeat protein
MNPVSDNPEDEALTARRISEAGQWLELLDFAQTWRKNIPEDYRAFYYLGLGHTGLGQFVQAEAAYRRALALDDSDAKVWGNLGELLYEHLKRPADGICCIERSLKLDPSQKLGWTNLACMVGRLGHHHHAITFADRALELDSQCVEAYLFKGAAAQALGKTDLLREICDALAHIPPEKFQRVR